MIKKNFNYLVFNLQVIFYLFLFETTIRNMIRFLKLFKKNLNDTYTVLKKINIL